MIAGRLLGYHTNTVSYGAMNVIDVLGCLTYGRYIRDAFCSAPSVPTPP